jgi:geranylgeranyl diphosphate synthase type I
VALPTLARYQRALDDFLQSVLEGRHPPLLDRMLRYHLGWVDVDGSPADARGKSLRPSLCLLTCDAAGGDHRRALPAAAAIELVHSFSLVHDDIQDRDEKRHHRPTVWSLWGEAQAINAGDALLALARLAALRLVEAGVPAGTTLEAAALLDQRTLEMVEGQVMDLEMEAAADADLPAYLAMIERKTGALFDCSLRMGGLLAGAPSQAVESLGRCGRLLGVTFQIKDDMLGVWGAENRTGKEIAADIRRRKKSLPIVFALSHADSSVRDQVRAVYSGPVTQEGVSIVLSALERAGAQQYCAALAAEKTGQAMSELAAAGLSGTAAEELRQAAEFLLDRDY